MTIKIRKVFINFEKEEKWLNDMAAKGLHLVGYTFCKYHFEKGKPGEYQYRIQLLDETPFHYETQEYLQFMEESGVECVCTYVRWAYFRKKAEDGPFEIYTDVESKINHFKKIAWLFGGLAAFNIVIATINTFLSTFNLYLSFINWAVALLLIPVTIQFMKRINELRKEQELFEK
ncbi:MAG: DUF2812 domain-containing protein [Bacillus sp. (in: Bacteria)]|nr:DUF2812 domain-containing protein [Bacillus sp. (in: firmicutes)]